MIYTHKLHASSNRWFIAQSIIQINEHGHNNRIANHVYHNNNGVRQNIEKLYADPDGVIWAKLLSNELVILAHDASRAILPAQNVEDTNTILFIPKKIYEVMQT